MFFNGVWTLFYFLVHMMKFMYKLYYSLVYVETNSRQVSIMSNDLALSRNFNRLKLLCYVLELDAYLIFCSIKTGLYFVSTNRHMLHQNVDSYENIYSSQF